MMTPDDILAAHKVYEGLTEERCTELRAQAQLELAEYGERSEDELVAYCLEMIHDESYHDVLNDIKCDMCENWFTAAEVAAMDQKVSGGEFICDGCYEQGELCGRCNGSGEGMHDGSTCRACGGSGERRPGRY